MVGEGYEVDAAGVRVTGPLVSKGQDTGVKIQVRAGGPAVGFSSPTSLMYQDPEIFLGFVSTDGAVQDSGEFPTMTVVAPFNINPQIIMWDPATYPNVKAIADLKATGAKVRYFGGAAYMEYFTANGILDAKQVDGNYDGTPANFVADGGKAAQQGFATSEPYYYENVLTDWAKPVAYQTVHDAGWTAYAQSLGGLPATIEANKDCLKLLVPMIQQSQVDYVTDPARANALILDLVTQYNNGWLYDAGQAAAAVELGLANNLIANSQSGIDLEAGTASTSVTGNLIGLQLDESAALTNNIGVELTDEPRRGDDDFVQWIGGASRAAVDGQRRRAGDDGRPAGAARNLHWGTLLKFVGPARNGLDQRRRCSG